nr:hypothetical protein [Tanacetum cinerariifolium]
MFLEKLKQLQLNISFIEALAQMPKYAQFLKGLLSNKTRLEEACTVTMNERCFAFLLNKLPLKEKDPGRFTIPCDIGNLHIDNALADLGASISLMPYLMYEKLGLGEPKTTRMSLELADSSEKPIWRIEHKDTTYSKLQGTHESGKIKNKHIYSASANEIDEKKPELKDLPSHLEYAYLNGGTTRPMSDIKGISPSFCMHKILMKESFKPVIQPQRRLNPKVQDVVKNEIVRLLDSGLIYPISDSLCVRPIHVIPKKGGITVVLNDNNELNPS